ncbi:transcription factor TFIIH complex subunit Tfb1 [Schizosaccharomyces cryophilus OY26]|uniref:Transcription factor TFIIH complex subunit Tfb1 n=1 Tax=Schizosaccharomyces cryophilus (strain OY26 / ATCC MYA-4695 / CBS 11777 / NBRC 106824 / NRRL Y48691) TaxID=653667 RepID=S9XGE6_SCHCR|nr:transcription factor TFIIH complex subunit Tfb1 [Schizosaccharomyces cryophilus OY26]EPY52751.1 transcription factor TFIIH complex subunit Tfb1 [Schizosaccharomyces cryophilus OY26]
MGDRIETYAYFKKKLGVISVDSRLKWTAEGKTNPAIDISFDAIANLQMTPASSPKIMVRVFIIMNKGEEPTPLVFSFTNTNNARGNCEMVTGELQKAITRQRDNTVSDEKSFGVESLNQKNLLEDIDLQESLLTSNSEMFQTFKEAVMKGHLSNEQFWSTRLHLLRAHAVERSQQRGPYNVLSSIKPKTVDNQMKVSLTRQQIHDMFEQHPLLRKVYNKHVPPLAEGEFWSRFFLSKLCKKFRGDRITPMDPYDDIMDQYLEANEEDSARKDEPPPSHVLDIEGNLQNASVLAELRPDITMRIDKEAVPFMKNINQLSERLLEKSLGNSKRLKTETENQYLQESGFHDLEEDRTDSKVILNIQEQDRFLETNFAPSSKQSMEEPLPPLETLQSLYQEENVQLDSMDRDINALAEAAQQLTHAMREKYEFETHGSDMNIPKELKEEVTMCHTVSVEFLHQFWSALLSPNYADKKIMEPLQHALLNSKTRVDAIVSQAKKQNVNPSYIYQLVSSILSSIDVALGEYQRRISITPST